MGGPVTPSLVNHFDAVPGHCLSVPPPDRDRNPDRPTILGPEGIVTEIEGGEAAAT